MVHMYIRMIEEQDDFGDMDHGLSESQAQKVQDLNDALVGGMAESLRIRSWITDSMLY